MILVVGCGELRLFILIIDVVARVVRISVVVCKHANGRFVVDELRLTRDKVAISAGVVVAVTSRADERLIRHERRAGRLERRVKANAASRCEKVRVRLQVGRLTHERRRNHRGRVLQRSLSMLLLRRRSLQYRIESKLRLRLLLLLLLLIGLGHAVEKTIRRRVK